MVKQSNGKLTQSWNQAVPIDRLGFCHQEEPPPQSQRTSANKTPLPAIQVPDSLVVTAAAYRKFMSKNRLDEVVEGLLAGVDVTRLEELQWPAAQIKGIIHTSTIPEPVYSRIYTACWRLGNGVTTVVWPVTMPYEQFRCTREFQECPYLEATNPDELIGAIKTWWASLFDPAAIHFRELNKQSHRNAEMTVAAQQVPHYQPKRSLSPFASAFSTPGIS